MANEPKQARRWKPRFSLRTLTIFVTLVCAYFGAWEATKRAVSHPYRSVSPMPLVIYIDEFAEPPFIHGAFDKPSLPTKSGWWTGPRRYYLWFFGPTVKLPFESSWEREDPRNNAIQGPKRMDWPLESRGP